MFEYAPAGYPARDLGRQKETLLNFLFEVNKRGVSVVKEYKQAEIASFYGGF